VAWQVETANPAKTPPHSNVDQWNIVWKEQCQRSPG